MTLRSSSTASASISKNLQWTQDSEPVSMLVLSNISDEPRPVLPSPVVQQSSGTRYRKAGSWRYLASSCRKFLKEFFSSDVSPNILPTSREPSLNIADIAVENIDVTKPFLDVVVVNWDDVKIDPNSSRDPDDSTPKVESTISPGDNPIPVESAKSRPWDFLTQTFFQYIRPVFVRPWQEHHKRETSGARQLAKCAALWLILNIALGFAVVPRPWMLMDYIYNIAVALPVTVFVVFMVFNPRDWIERRYWVYQCFLIFSLWMWAIYQILFMFICGYYAPEEAKFSCGTRDFMSTFFYATAMQIIGLFGLGLDRLPALVGAITFLISSCGMIIRQRSSWWRLIINFVFFHAFIIFIHYKMEITQFKVFEQQLKLIKNQNAVIRAQKNEQKIYVEKQRLTAYIFHEVRVPLNTAILAAQNLETSIFARNTDDFLGLKSSLKAMSQVLNDILDFNRMDTGNFESVSKPYAFHQVIDSIFGTFKSTTAARDQNLLCEMDPNIDVVARRAAYTAMGEPQEAIEKHIQNHPNAVGLVVGDEVRLRQVVNNLASNACKFTPKGGTITIRTKLVEINQNETKAVDNDSISGRPHSLTSTNLDHHNSIHSVKRDPFIVVRVEVQDTGYGIDPAEMKKNKLFTPFTQTENGKLQGGSGSGLGLALVRHIIHGSNGRLGVFSGKGKGSIFWIELKLSVGAQTLYVDDMQEDGQTKVSEDDSAKLIMNNLNQEMTEKKKNLNPGNLPTPASPANPDVQSPESNKPTKSKSFPPPLSFNRMETYDRNLSKPSGGVTPDSPADFTGMSVLAVDDDELTRKLMTRMLQRLRCKPSVAPNGQRALQMILDLEESSSQHRRTPNGSPLSEYPSRRRTSEEVFTPDSTASHVPQKYDIVFLDNQMPVLNGLDTVRKLREMGRKDFIVGLTGNAMKADTDAFINAGVDEVLTKPIFEQSLREVLKKAYTRRKKHSRPKNEDYFS